MRDGIINEIHQLMVDNDQVYFLTGDLGWLTLEKIENDFPQRFINVGIAEQNLIGIAAGLALSGKKVFVYSIIPFVTMRCYEQIRNDICLHNLDVTILGIGMGLSYGILSSTHFALEDVAILRVLPNMTIFSPADETEAILGMRYLRTYKHPVYVRIGKRQEPKVFTKPYKFKFGKGVIVQKGDDITIFSSGPIISEVIQATKILEEKSKKTCTIVDIHTIKPLDEELIIKESKNKNKIFVVEEHFICGGLGSAISEIISSCLPGVRVVRIGVENSFIKKIGTQSYLRKLLKLDGVGIAEQILNQS